ncbi:MAG: transcription coactivator PC4 [Amphiamblys sp. WSBS2006]|nr:MAG: transcription coactivator PC4 [Amphiamblys sp. WSBS2006]
MAKGEKGEWYAIKSECAKHDASDVADAEPPKKTQKKQDKSGGEYYELSEKKRVSVSKWGNRVKVNIREYWVKSENEMLPTKKGVMLSLEEWETLKEILADIDGEIKSKL